MRKLLYQLVFVGGLSVGLIVILCNGCSRPPKHPVQSHFFSILQSCIELYEIDTGNYPPSLNALRKNPGVKGWNGPYVHQEKRLCDPWNNTLLYATEENGYYFISAGPDGVFGTKDDIIVRGRR